MTLFLLNLISLAFFSFSFAFLRGDHVYFFMLKIEDFFPCSRHGRFKKKQKKSAIAHANGVREYEQAAP